MKDDLVKTEKELNVITEDLMITYKMDKTGKLDKTDALQELKHINTLHKNSTLTSLDVFDDCYDFENIMLIVNALSKNHKKYFKNLITNSSFRYSSG
ncbi:25404_t:CDS:2, partial [Gigaspora rosea]